MNSLFSRSVRRLFTLLFVLAIALPALVSKAELLERANISDDFPTVAEKSGYTATSTSAEVEGFLKEVLQNRDHLKLFSIGKTVEERDIWCVGPKESSSERLQVVLMANIHSGECDGKEALLALIRELAVDSRHPWFSACDVYVVPNFNADGNDRVGLKHRPGQVGPEKGVGIRENAQQLDLNRDFMKLETPEVRAIVRLVNEVNPDLFIDCHTTNGSQHGYQLTYALTNNPNFDSGLRQYAADKFLPAVTATMDAKGRPTFYYGNFDREKTKWTTFGFEPRYCTEYIGLRGTLAILSESYTYETYENRVLATSEFVKSCVEQVITDRAEVRKLINGARANPLVEQNRATKVALDAELTSFEEKVQVLSGKRSDGEPTPIQIEYWGKYLPAKEVGIPSGYLIDADQSWIAGRLRMHGIPVFELETPTTLEVDDLRIITVQRANEPFQKHRRVSGEIEPVATKREFSVGTYFVPLNCPQWRIASLLLEPQSTDSFLAWNFLDDYSQPNSILPVHRFRAGEANWKPVESIKPREKLTLDKLFKPRATVNYSGGFPTRATWEKSKSGEVRLSHTWNGRPVWSDPVTGAMDEPEESQTQEIPATAVQMLELDEGAKKNLLSGGKEWDKAKQNALLQFGNDLFGYDSKSGVLRRLTNDQDQEELAEISPDGQHVAYVKKNNLIIASIVTGESHAISEDGSDSVFNGKLDWVYQEEIYGRGNFKAFWWSADSKSIAFLRLDETAVHKFTVVDHLPVRQELEVIPYPKAGDPNPKVGLGLFSVDTRKVDWVDISHAQTPEPLISRVTWHPEQNLLYYQIQDRPQTWIELVAVDRSSGAAARPLFRESEGAWRESPGDPQFLKDGSFLWLSPRNGFNHIYHYSANGELLNQVSSGEGEVRSIIEVDELNGVVYFFANIDTAVEQHAYSVKLDGSNQRRLTSLGANHTIRLSPDYQFFVDSSSTAGTLPRVDLRSIDGRFVRTIDPNLADRLEYVDIAKPEFFKVPTPDGHQLDAMLIRPSNFDPSKKYPVIVHLYSGPQTPTVRNQYQGTNYLWHQMLAQHGYCIWMCDNRSASHAGAKHAWPIHRDLGKNELVDIETGLDWLKKQPGIDGERIGIWGWSYGGYMTAYALTHSKSFKVGISGAPVTDWQNYDSVYTERYMGLPQDNPSGYKSSSVVEAAGDLHGKLLLIHGTIDDNVHLSNTLQLVNALQNAGKQFDLMVYPRNRHGVSNPQQNVHLKTLMTEYFLKNL